MNSGPICQRVLRQAVILLGTGGLLFGVGSGCDPTVRTTVLGGFQQLATTLVTAGFLILQNQQNTSTTGTTTGSTSGSTTGTTTGT